MPPRSALWTLLLLTGALAALPLAMPATAIAQTSSGAAAFYEDTLDTSASTNIPNCTGKRFRQPFTDSGRYC